MYLQKLFIRSSQVGYSTTYEDINFAGFNNSVALFKS